MKQSNNIKLVFFGSSRYVVPVVKVLKEKFELVLVVTTEQNSFDAIPFYCQTNKIPFISVQQFNNLTMQTIKDAYASFAVLAYFGLIIPQKVLKIFSKGIINIHPSLLPKYRGPTPVQNAILNGEKVTGVSIIRLDEKVDHGPIIAQKVEKILEDDTADTLYARLFKIGADLIYQNIKQYIKGHLKPRQQNHSKATFTKLLHKNDGQINIDNPPPFDKLKKMIRAFYPWPGVFFKYKFDNKERIIKLLPKNKIQVEGKKPMSYKDFMNGYSLGKEILKKLNLD